MTIGNLGVITFSGVSNGVQRISTNVYYTVADHGPITGTAPDPTPSEWEQFVAAVKADADRAEQAAKDASTSADAAEKSAQAAAESAKQAAQATADIGEAKDDALEAIQQAQDTGVQAIQTAHQAALEAIGQTEQAAIGQVQQAGTEQVQAVETAGQTQLDKIDAANALVPTPTDADAGKAVIVKADGSGYELGDVQVDAYSKAESDARYAPAIWDTTPLAAEHEIYAADGTPLRVVQQGETTQGDDPSPDNPQAIEGIDSPVTAQTSDGQTTRSISMDIDTPLYGDDGVVDTVANDVPSGCDKVIMLDGSEDEGWAVYAAAIGGNRATSIQGAPDMEMNADGSAVMAYSDRLPVVLAGATNNGSIGVALYQGNIYVYVPGITDVAGFRAVLAANPVKIWYRSTAYTEAADLHIDKVMRRWRMVELDGMENGSRIATSGGGDPYYYQMTDAKFSGGLAPSTPGWEDATKSTHFLPGNAYSEKGNLVAVLTHSGVSVCRLGFAPDPFTSYQEMRSWLAAQAAAGTPVRVLYQLATPEEYASDPHTLPALGSLPETVKATGQSTVGYSVDTKSYIDAKFAALSAAMLGG